MEKVWIPGYLHFRTGMFWSPKHALEFRNATALRFYFRHAVLPHQPFRDGRIEQPHIDLVAVLLAELLKRPVGDKGVQDPQSSSRNPDLYLGYRHAKKVGSPFPGVCVITTCKGIRDSFNCGGVQRNPNLVAKCCQRSCRYARIAHFKHAISDKIPQSIGAYA